MTVFDRAICFAVNAHQGQLRKGVAVPYIIHPMEVAAICSTLTSDLEVLAAAVLHDTVEDTDATIEEIAAQFGPRVAALVSAETENKYKELPPEETWQLRKSESLEKLKNSEDVGVRILWLGDKLANIRSYYRNWLVSGDKIWEDFNQKDPSRQAWYYRNIVELLKGLKDTDAWIELRDTVQALFGEELQQGEMKRCLSDAPLPAQGEAQPDAADREQKEGEAL